MDAAFGAEVVVWGLLEFEFDVSGVRGFNHFNFLLSKSLRRSRRQAGHAPRLYCFYIVIILLCVVSHYTLVVV